MTILHLTSELTTRVDAFGARFHAARMGALAALPGDPFGVEVRPLTNGVAVLVRHPLLRNKNRILNLGGGDVDILDEILQSYRSEDLPVQLFVAKTQMTPQLFQRLVAAGLWSAGSDTVPVISPGASAVAPPIRGIHVRRSGDDEKEEYLDLFQRAFVGRSEEAPEYRAFQWAEDSLPGSTRYIAEIDGKPVGMAAFVAIDGIGLCSTAGVLPEYRGRGIQGALIRQRIDDAYALGCDLVLGGGRHGTTTYRNFERAGMHLVPTGTAWGDTPK